MDKGGTTSQKRAIPAALTQKTPKRSNQPRPNNWYVLGDLVLIGGEHGNRNGLGPMPEMAGNRIRGQIGKPAGGGWKLNVCCLLIEGSLREAGFK